eukprot:Phypoly_transcript_00641.p1 GENE.Phypoly_transcript_00641~~Phypoly_transcript_00641.p1  ORF type:complete len:1297 (+),score=194.44 Phypoly_transcript_00641:293-4183(+)
MVSYAPENLRLFYGLGACPQIARVSMFTSSTGKPSEVRNKNLHNAVSLFPMGRTLVNVTLLCIITCLPLVYGDTNKTFKIGMMRDLFLRYAPMDTTYFQGAEYFATWANKRGGIYYGGELLPVELITRDASTADATKTAATVKQQFENLINIDNITIAVGPYMAGRAGAAINITEKYNILNFCVQPSTSAYQNVPRKYAFQWTFKIEDYLNAIVPKLPEVKSFVLLGNGDPTYAVNYYAHIALNYLDKLGWQNKGVLWMNTSMSDNSGLEDMYSQAIANLTSDAGEIDLFCGLIPRDHILQTVGGFSLNVPENIKAATIMIPFTKSDFTAPNLKTDQWLTFSQFQSTLNEGVSGVLGGTASEFAADFRAQYGVWPAGNTAQIAATLMAFYYVANLTGSTDPNVLRDALTNITLPLFTGPLSFSPTYLLTQAKPYPYQVVRNATFDITSAYTIVYPAQFSWIAKMHSVNSRKIIEIVVPSGIVVIAGVIVAAFFIHRQRRMAVAALIKAEEGEKRTYKIDFRELEVGSELGEGSFGKVYRGVYKGADVAVKKLKQQKMSRQQLDEFAQEAAVMTGLRHPNIVLFMGVCLEPANICIVTELMQKGSLFDILHDENVKLPFPLIMHMAQDILQGLYFIHSSGFVHRDLKSLNLLVDKKWSIKISDFGLSCTKAQASTYAQISLLWTAPEVLMMTPGCYSEKSDIYSFGIILWEMISREIPFNHVLPAALQNAIVTGTRPKMSPQWDEGYCKLMRLCWANQAEDRPTVKECRQALEAIPVLENPHEGSSYGSSSLGPLIPAPQPPLALVFTDVQSSTELWEMEPRIMMRALTLHNEVLRALIRKLDGYEVKTEGDAFMIAFSDPIAATNFCLRAQMELLSSSWPELLSTHPHASTKSCEGGNPMYNGLRVRMGIHYGCPLAERDQRTNKMDYLGHMVNVAARISGFGTGGQIIIGQEMHKLIAESNKVDPYDLESLGGRSLKGLKGVFHLYRITPAPLKARFSDIFYPPDISGEESFINKPRSSTKFDMRSSYLLVKNEKWVIQYEDLKIDSAVGAGAYGTVHSGEYQGKKVAIKKFINQKVKENALLDMRAESAILSELEHPNIVHFFGSCVKPPHLCIVTELMGKGCLAMVLHDPAITLPWFPIRLDFAKGIAKGLEYLHAHNIIHRDIKSSNILVGDDWNVKIADFGFSRIKADNQTMTQCGTVAWTAPEIFDGTHYTEKADVYGFGVVLWEIISRRKPWEGIHAMKIVQNVLAGFRPAEERFLSPEVPANIKNLMKKCWDQDPIQRPTSDAIVMQL